MAAPTNYYVNPAIAGNSGTGTLLDPFGDLQYALDTIARDATNGDQVNIKAGTAEILAASLTLATYGTPAEGAPLILRGYTSAAGDGGMAEINCNGAIMWASTAYVWIGLIDLQIHSPGNNRLIDYSSSGAGTFLFRCQCHKGASSPSGKVMLAAVGDVCGCWIHDTGATGTAISSSKSIRNNYIYNSPTGINMALNGTVWNNIIVDCAIGITTGADDIQIINNSIYSSTANTGTGINVAAGHSHSKIMNNIIEGYSGVGGKAIAAGTDIAILGYNAFYNNTATNSVADVIVDLTANDVALAASPFTNAAGGDFSLNTAVVGAIDGAFPNVWYGPASTTDHADIGAVQNGAGAGGNVNHLRGKL